MFCVLILYISNQQLKDDSEQQSSENIFMAILFTFAFFPRNLLGGSYRNNILFAYRFVGDVRPGVGTEA